MSKGRWAARNIINNHEDDKVNDEMEEEEEYDDLPSHRSHQNIITHSTIDHDDDEDEDEDDDDDDDDDDPFFNDPRLHEQLDRVESQFIINNSQQPSHPTTTGLIKPHDQHRVETQPASKRIKLDHHHRSIEAIIDPKPSSSSSSSSSNKQDPIDPSELVHHPIQPTNPDRDRDQELIRLKDEIDRVREALKRADQDKIRLKGEVSIVRSTLESSRSHSNHQLAQLRSIERNIRLRAERAESELSRLKDHWELKDTFKSFEQNLKRPLPPPPPPPPSSSLSSNLPIGQLDQLEPHHHHQARSTLKYSNPKQIPQNPSPSSSHPPHPTSQRLRPSLPVPQYDHHQPSPPPPPPPPPPPSSSPLPDSFKRFKKLNSQSIQDLSSNHHHHHHHHHHPNQLIHTIIVNLFQTFVLDLHPIHPTKSDIPSTTIINSIPIIQTILQSSHQLTNQPDLKNRFDKLVMNLFISLTRPFDDQVQDLNFPNPTGLDHHQLDPRPTFELDPQARDETVVLNFIAELGSILIRITELLSKTNLAEAKANSIVILNILVQSSPLFTSYLLNHSDFNRFKPSTRVEIEIQNPQTQVQELVKDQHVDLLTVLLDYFDQVTRSFEYREHRRMIGTTPRSEPTSDQSLEHESASYQSIKRLSLVHLALLDLIQSIVWDPPEACYRTLADFLKSNRVFNFLLIENQSKSKLCKSMNILISLASRSEFSKIILTSQVKHLDHVDNSTRLPITNPISIPQTAHQPPTTGTKRKIQKSNTLSSSSITFEKVNSDEAEEEPEEEGCQPKISVIDRLMRILALSLNDHYRQTPKPDQERIAAPEGRKPGYEKMIDSEAQDFDRFNDELKIKILVTLNLLGIKSSSDSYFNSSNSQKEPPEDDLHPLNGFQAMAQSSKFLFSILIQSIFFDSFFLWNCDGSIFHKLQIPKCIERIELAIELVSKIVFNNQKDPINLIERLKRESNECSQLPSSLLPTGSSSSTGLKALFGFQNIYHEFIISFAKLSFSDLVVPHHHHHQQQQPQQTQSRQDPPYHQVRKHPSVQDDPKLGSTSNHVLHFRNYLSNDLVNRLDNIGDLAYDLLQSVASPDELDEWRLCSIEEEEEDDDDEEEDDPREEEHEEMERLN